MSRGLLFLQMVLQILALGLYPCAIRSAGFLEWDCWPEGSTGASPFMGCCPTAQQGGTRWQGVWDLPSLTSASDMRPV